MDREGKTKAAESAWEALPESVLAVVRSKLVPSHKAPRTLRSVCGSWKACVDGAGPASVWVRGPHPESAGSVLRGVTAVLWHSPPDDLSGAPLQGVVRMTLMCPCDDPFVTDTPALTSFLRSERRPSNLEYLKVYGFRVSRESADLICTLTSLRELSICFSRLTYGDALRSLSRHRTLRSLEIASDSRSVRDEGLLALGDMESLETLSLSHCDGVTDAGFARLGRISTLSLSESDLSLLTGSFLGHLAGLRSLRLRGGRRSEGAAAVPSFLRCLKDLPLLEAVDVDGRTVRAGDLVVRGLKVLEIPCGVCERRDLVGELTHFGALTALDVSCVRDILVADLRPLVSLESLKIAKFGDEPYDPFARRTQESDRAAEERQMANMEAGFAAIAATLPSLKALDMSHPSVSVPYGRGTLEVVKNRMPALTALDMSWGEVEGDEALASLSHLKSLNISNCYGMITDAGLAHLAGLSYVGLTPSRLFGVTDRGLDALTRTVGTVGLYIDRMIRF